jgi:hypothetical protein
MGLVDLLISSIVKNSIHYIITILILISTLISFGNRATASIIAAAQAESLVMHSVPRSCWDISLAGIPTRCAALSVSSEAPGNRIAQIQVYKIGDLHATE